MLTEGDPWAALLRNGEALNPPRLAVREFESCEAQAQAEA